MNRLQSHHLPAAVGRVRESIREADHDLRTDPDLLERFARYGEHPAFEAILRRHGPMVLGVCRRTLVNSADVDDAFQATFLVLIRKARSIRKDRLGPWLYGVAFRVALKARGRAARVAARQTEVTDMIPDPTLPSDPPDWLPILDAELSALPAKYREPMVLCELQGLSRAEAARVLGIPEGTLSSRLSRGREMLRNRLLRHGTLLPAGGLAALLSESVPGRATVPAGLLARTAELAATGLGASGAVPAGPARLTDEVVKDMFLIQLRVMSGAVLAAGLVATGLVMGWAADAPGQPEQPKSVVKVEADSPSAKPVAGWQVRPDREAIQGLWLFESVDHGRLYNFMNTKEGQDARGKPFALISGDVWWDVSGSISPAWIRIDPEKNPKWLDIAGSQAPKRAAPRRQIYRLDCDRLKIADVTGHEGHRPAEFTGDEISESTVYDLRRGVDPTPCVEKAILGSWVGETPLDENGRLKEKSNPNRVEFETTRVEILDEYLFALIPGDYFGDGCWIGGRYTLNTTKNPKWIDIDLFNEYPNTKVKKLHGCYEITDGHLKLSLGLTGKPILRSLQFEPPVSNPPTWMYFDLKRAAIPLSELLKPQSSEPVPIAPPPHRKVSGPLSVDSSCVR